MRCFAITVLFKNTFASRYNYRTITITVRANYFRSVQMLDDVYIF